jgi:anti-sigma regulatory factor (Ser/Thr protein kinase)
MSAGSHSRTDTERAVLTPDHLVVWLTGAADDPPVVDDARLGSDFELSEWFEELRPGYPDAVLGALYRGAAGDDGSWRRMVESAARVRLTDDPRAFTGDTTPTSLRALRRWVSNQLGADHAHVDDVVLAVSELATNVERHAASWLTVDLVQLPDDTLIAVTDPTTDALPLPRSVPAEQVSGRGLLVVAALARWWGVVVRPQSKTVWAAIPAIGRISPGRPSDSSGSDGRDR